MILRRVSVWVVAVLVAALVAASVSWTSGGRLVIVDEHGAPATDAYVRYHYEGHLINFVHPVSYVARGSVIVRADAAGSVSIPGHIHVRRPLPLSTPPTLFIDHVYIPRLHNAFGPIAARTASRPGVFTVDDRLQRVTAADVSQSPERWETSLRYLFDAIRGTAPSTGSVTAASPRDVQTASHARELVAHLRAEYAAFLARFGTTARERPEPLSGGSEVDREAWQKQIDAALRREPLWGPFMVRVWDNNFTELEAVEAAWLR